MTDFSFAEFIEMGGYASYIWPVYGLAAIMMVGLILHALSRRKSVEKELLLLQESQKKS